MAVNPAARGRFADDRGDPQIVGQFVVEDSCGTVIPGYTLPMKTAISVPDETFDRVSRRAAAMGVSRSEFFARAAQQYLDELDAASLTEQIDIALEGLGSPDATHEEAVDAGRHVLGATADEW